MKPMEIDLGSYGSMMFEIMLTDRDPPPHWQSIKKEALPLVEQLLALNEKMTGGGYKILGVKKNGKTVLSDSKRIDLAAKKLWGVKAKALKKGDRVWVNNYDLEMDFRNDDPATVTDVTKSSVYIDHYDRIFCVAKTEEVFKAPKDWSEDNNYSEDDYWLKKADELGV